MSMSVEVEEYNSLSSFQNLRAEWDSLLSTNPNRTLCLSHDWLSTWWQAFGGNYDQIRVLVLRQDGQLIAAAPLLVGRTQLVGVPIHTVEFLANLHTFRFDFVLKCGQGREPLLHRLLNHILAGDKSRDVFFFKDLPRDSDTIEAIERFASTHGWKVGFENRRRSLRVSLEGEWEGYLASLSKRFRKSLRQSYKKCLEAGVVFECVCGEDRARTVLEEGLKLEASSWKGRQDTAILNDPNEARFYRELTERLAPKGQLRQYGLRMGDRMIAWDLCVFYDNVCHSLKTAYSEAHSMLSPGKVIVMLELQQMFHDRDVTRYDLLPPDVDYKRHWSKDGIEQVSVRLYGRGLYARLAYLLHAKLRPFLGRSRILRAMKHRLVH